MHATTWPVWLAVLGCLIVGGCSWSVEVLGESAQPVVYGDDDRKEYFEVADPNARSVIAESIVALISKRSLGSAPGTIVAKTWGEVANLCPGEPFAEQPAAAFCTGVLVDWDLILTAGHCARLFSLEETAVIFNYYYEAQGKLAYRADDVVGIREIIAEALDPEGKVPRLDYAWLRLDAPVAPPRRPAAIRVELPSLSVDDPIIVIGAGGGVPIKLDAGGKVRTWRDQAMDFFIADADTSKGSSGSGAFAADYALLGVLSRGGPDFIERSDGCRTTIHAAGETADEQFTFAYQAVSGLCQKGSQVSSICRADCGFPCRALPRDDAAISCSIARVPEANGAHGPIGFATIALLFWRRKQRLARMERTAA